LLPAAHGGKTTEKGKQKLSKGLEQKTQSMTHAHNSDFTNKVTELIKHKLRSEQ
jgi:hypothetical protein